MFGYTMFILPLVFIVLISIPLVNVFRGRTSKKVAKARLLTHICLFFGMIIGVFLFQIFKVPSIFAQDSSTQEVINGIVGTTAQGLGFLSAALSTGLSALGAGIAVAAAAPAAIGAFSENEKNFGKSLIFVALGEGVAIYGLLISILIINQL